MARKNYARLMASLFQNKEQVRNTGVWMKQQKNVNEAEEEGERIEV